MLRPYKDLGQSGPAMSGGNFSAGAKPAVLARLPQAGSDEPGECGAKRKRAKPRLSRSFTRELLYQN